MTSWYFPFGQVWWWRRHDALSPALTGFGGMWWRRYASHGLLGSGFEAEGMTVKTQDDLDRLMNLARSFAMYSRKAEHAATERDRLVAEQCRKADQAALVRGWIEEDDIQPTPEQTAWDLNYLRWTQAAEEAGRLIDPLLEKLGLTVEDVVEPLLLAA
jgi:hypothetical protein